MCDYIHYVLMVPADHSEDSVIGRYHMCDYIYYVLTVGSKTVAMFGSFEVVAK